MLDAEFVEEKGENLGSSGNLFSKNKEEYRDSFGTSDFATTETREY